MLLLLVFVAPLSSIFLGLFRNRKKQPLLFHPPPGPKGLPIIGNLHQFEHSHSDIYFSKLGKIYGSIFTLQLANKPVVVIQSVKLAKEVLQTQEKNFSSRPFTAGRYKLSYNGLDIAFSPYSKYLKEMKKILVINLLSSKKVLSFAPIRQDEVSRLIQKVSSLSSASKIVNLNQLVLSFASSNSGRIAFGRRYGDEEMLGIRYYSLLHEAEEMFTEFFYSDYLPLGGLLDKLTGKSSKLEKTFKDLDAIYEKIIHDHLDANRAEGKHEMEDIVDVLIRLMNDSSFPFKITRNHIKGILMNLFIGGANTTTTGIIWAIMELVKNPIEMRKVQEELRKVGQKKGLIEESDLPNLHYFKAAVTEAFRLHPPAPILVPREVVQKSIIDGYDILPQTTVFVNACAIGRDPEFWMEPDKFMPERFLGNSMEFKGEDSTSMYTFGGGRRMCPGFTLGLANLELALANLLYAFNWELPPGLNTEDIDSSMLPGIVTLKEKPLCLIPTKF